MRKLRPISLELIEEGRLLASLDEEIKGAAQKLIDHVRRYGVEKTAKDKVELTLKLTIQHEGHDIGDYSIKAAIATKLPGRPVSATIAIHEQEQTGEETLFVRASGSTEETPRQGRLATDDGRGVNQETGEVISSKNKKGEAR